MINQHESKQMAKLLVSYGHLYTEQRNKELLKSLLEKTNWQSNFMAYGRHFELPRLQCWHADDGIHYRYTDNKLKTHPWTSELLTIKQHIESKTNTNFNSVLLTYYRDGNDQVGWHADNEIELGETPFIASLSLGATRQFHYRHKQTLERSFMPLHDGELLVMQPAFQQHWEHSILPENKVTKPRLNLTFRQVVI